MRVGWRALCRRPWRTLLVLQGVIWGVAVAIVPPAEVPEEEAEELYEEPVAEPEVIGREAKVKPEEEAEGPEG